VATVRVLAARLGSDHLPVTRLAYRAQLFEDDVIGDAAWTCSHDHATPLEAQSCGLQHLNDLLAGPQELSATGS
jgi:hypothetical protein